MTQEAPPIDISAMPELARLAEEVARTGERRVLRRGDVEVAVLIPARPRARRQRGKTLTPAQTAAVLSTAGGWKGLVDGEQFKREIKAARGSRRPPVEL